jgi:hypothetical protein
MSQLLRTVITVEIVGVVAVVAAEVVVVTI